MMLMLMPVLALILMEPCLCFYYWFPPLLCSRITTIDASQKDLVVNDADGDAYTDTDGNMYIFYWFVNDSDRVRTMMFQCLCF